MPQRGPGVSAFSSLFGGASFPSNARQGPGRPCGKLVTGELATSYKGLGLFHPLSQPFPRRDILDMGQLAVGPLAQLWDQDVSHQIENDLGVRARQVPGPPSLHPSSVPLAFSSPSSFIYDYYFELWPAERIL